MLTWFTGLRLRRLARPDPTEDSKQSQGQSNLDEADTKFGLSKEGALFTRVPALSPALSPAGPSSAVGLQWPLRPGPDP